MERARGGRAGRKRSLLGAGRMGGKDAAFQSGY